MASGLSTQAPGGFNSSGSLNSPAGNPLFAKAPLTLTPPKQLNVSGTNIYDTKSGTNLTPSVPSPTTQTQSPASPTTVVGSSPAAKQSTAIKTAVTKQQESNDTAANTPTPYNDVRDPATGLLLNPPGALYDRNTGKLLNPPSTDSAPTAEDKIANAPDEGMQEAYNVQTGQREDQPTGALPSGYSNQNPQTRTDVSSTADVGNGIQFKQFSDGTYGRFDASGNYSSATAQAFSDAQAQEQVSKKIAAIQNGTFQLPPNQQAQLDGLSSRYAALIQAQQTTNANSQGVASLAENMYGLGNSIVGQGVVTGVVNAGLQKVADLQSELATGLATMQDAFDKDDMSQLKDAWDSYQANQTDVQSEIDKVTAYVQAQQDKQQAVIDNKNMNYALQQAAKYGDAGILPTDTPQQVDAKKQQNSSIYRYETGTKSGSVDQNALDGMISSYRKTGNVPSFGFGATGTPMRTAFWAAINGTPGSVDQAALSKAALTASTKALVTQQNQYSAAKTSIDQMKQSLGIASGYESKLDNTGSPIVQKYLNSLKTGVFGSPDVAALNTAVTTAANEYARILSGASASIGGTSVSSANEVKDLLNAAMSKGQFDAVMSVMQQDANARIAAQKNTIDSIQSDIVDIGSDAGGSSNSGSSSASDATSGWGWNG